MQLALLSFWHVHADDYVCEALEHPAVTLRTAWDADEDRGVAKAAKYGLKYQPDLEAILADPGVVGVIVTSSTAEHLDLIPRAARAGKHIFTEKVIAPTLADTDAILAAVAEAGVTLRVALNRAVESATLKAMELIDAGELGEIRDVSVRLAHDGALATVENPSGWLPERFYDPTEAGGGALIDLGAHPLYVTRLLLGMPARLQAVARSETGRSVEDGAIVTFHAANGATGTAEVSIADADRGYALSVTGSSGSITYTQGGDFLLERNGVTETIELEIEWPRPFARFVETVRRATQPAHTPPGQGEQPLPVVRTDQLTIPIDNLALARDLSALVEASYRSIATGEAVDLAALGYLAPTAEVARVS
jgi:predicted dehydrogenase